MTQVVKWLSCYAGSTALSAAAQFGHHEIVKLLLNKTANPNLKDHTGIDIQKKSSFWAILKYQPMGKTENENKKIGEI